MLQYSESASHTSECLVQVDHSISLQSLFTSFGLVTQSLKWFLSFLPERINSMVLDSPTSPAQFGVLQGSVRVFCYYSLCYRCLPFAYTSRAVDCINVGVQNNSEASLI